MTQTMKTGIDIDGGRIIRLGEYVRNESVLVIREVERYLIR